MIFVSRILVEDSENFYLKILHLNYFSDKQQIEFL